MNTVSITHFRIVENHPYLRALADLRFGGIQLRGLRLEEKSRGELTLGFPGRKIQGYWQVLYETQCPRLQQQILQSLECYYRNSEMAA